MGKYTLLDRQIWETYKGILTKIATNLAIISQHRQIWENKRA